MTNWKTYYTSKSNKFICNNESAELFKQTAMPNRNTNETIGRLSADRGDSILIYFSKISNSIQILHSIIDLGNNNLHPLPKVIALNGTGENQASPVQIDLESLSTDISIRAPTVERLLAIQTKEDLITIEAPDTGFDSFKHLPFILLPPILWEATLSSTSKKPEDLFLVLKNSIIEYDSINSRSDDKDEVAESCYHILHFLWAATKSEIPSLIVGPLGDDEEAGIWAKNRHSNCLGPQTSCTSQTPTRERDLWSIEAMNQIIEKSSQNLNDEQGKTKKGFEKLHDSTKLLILNASSPNGEIAASSPPEDCRLFFQAASHGSAKLFILKSLKNKFGCNVEIAQGVIMNIFNGNFLRSFDESPSNFSPFSFPKKSLFGKGKTAEKECLILQLKELSGKGLTNEDVEAALKQGVRIPESIEELRFSIFNTVSVAAFFFSPTSILTRKLKTIHDHIASHYPLYEVSQFDDNLFTAKFLFAINTRIQLWLEMCETKESREMVDDNLINFEHLLNNIVLRTFNISLPPAIKQVSEKASRPDSNERSTNKRQRIDNKPNKDQAAGKMENLGRIEPWILGHDEYSSSLRHSEALRSRPKLDGTPVCHRFHSKGYCFHNCANKTTHINSSKLAPELKKEYEKWLKSVSSN